MSSAQVSPTKKSRFNYKQIITPKSGKTGGSSRRESLPATGSFMGTGAFMISNSQEEWKDMTDLRYKLKKTETRERKTRRGGVPEELETGVAKVEHVKLKRLELRDRGRKKENGKEQKKKLPEIKLKSSKHEVLTRTDSGTKQQPIVVETVMEATQPSPPPTPITAQPTNDYPPTPTTAIPSTPQKTYPKGVVVMKSTARASIPKASLNKENLTKQDSGRNDSPTKLAKTQQRRSSATEKVPVKVPEVQLKHVETQKIKRRDSNAPTVTISKTSLKTYTQPQTAEQQPKFGASDIMSRLNSLKNEETTKLEKDMMLKLSSLTTDSTTNIKPTTTDTHIVAPKTPIENTLARKLLPVSDPYDSKSLIPKLSETEIAMSAKGPLARTAIPLAKLTREMDVIHDGPERVYKKIEFPDAVDPDEDIVSSDDEGFMSGLAILRRPMLPPPEPPRRPPNPPPRTTSTIVQSNPAPPMVQSTSTVKKVTAVVVSSPKQSRPVDLPNLKPAKSLLNLVVDLLPTGTSTPVSDVPTPDTPVLSPSHFQTKKSLLDCTKTSHRTSSPPTFGAKVPISKKQPIPPPKKPAVQSGIKQPTNILAPKLTSITIPKPMLQQTTTTVTHNSQSNQQQSHVTKVHPSPQPKSASAYQTKTKTNRAATATTTAPSYSSASVVTEKIFFPRASGIISKQPEPAQPQKISVQDNFEECKDISSDHIPMMPAILAQPYKQPSVQQQSQQENDGIFRRIRSALNVIVQK